MRAFAAMVAGGLLLSLSVPSTAHEFSRQGVTIAHPWARATPGGAKAGSAYLEIKAAARANDRLIGARSAVAANAEIHASSIEGGVARMRRVEGIAVTGGKSVVLKPDGYHVMLTDLHAPLVEGDLLKLTLLFEKAGEIEVDATVEPAGAMGPHGFDHQPGAPKSSSGGGHRH